jgi:hypothetical protein
MPPTFDDDLGLLEGVEDFLFKKFVPSLRVEVLAISVIPGTICLSRFYETVASRPNGCAPDVFTP